jgi:HSP20 family molecular chaperone IbpA
VVSLGAEVDVDAARARYENGLLIVELPIRPAPPAQSVPIRPVDP